MPTVDAEHWNVSLLQDKRWRRAVVQLQPGTPTPHRLKAARKILRDGNDLACCMLFAACRAADPEEHWGPQHPFEPVRGAVRFRALRILGRPSRLQGRDHCEAAQLLPWLVKPRDQVILHRQLTEGSPARVIPALRALGRVIDALDPIVPELRADLEALAGDANQPPAVHEVLAEALVRWSAPDAIRLLQHGACLQAHTLRWPHLSALLTREPVLGRPLVEAHLDAIGPHHIHAADVQRALSACPPQRAP